jgi:ABC-type uncharacterized transport system involved in gliding motility auxiliary subunit
MSDGNTTGKNGLWKQRGRRCATGLNVAIMTALAAVVFAMINFIAYRYLDVRWDLSATRFYELSDKTRGLLGSLDRPVSVVAFFQKNHPQYEDVRRLLRQYEYEAARLNVDLHVQYVDPDRDLAQARELARKYDVSEANVVVFECDGRRWYVTAPNLVDFEVKIEGSSVSKKLVDFKGEQAFSSAIQSVAQAARPVVYFLTGHGEHDINDGSRQFGYSRIGRLIRNDNIEVKPLQLAGQKGVPDECSALVIAGPDRRLSMAEVDMISSYLSHNGRVFALLDSGMTTGLEDLMGRWGVRLTNDVVVGMTLSGRDLVVTRYGEHPLVRRIRKLMTMFWMPRSVEPAEGVLLNGDGAADRPRVTALAFCGPEGWQETNLEQNPPQFDKDQDRRGPISVAVAVEKGPPGGIDVQLKPTRMVVVGDADFASNAALESGVGGMSDFFMSALNWLLEREALMAIAPKIPGQVNLDMDQRQIARAMAIMVLGLPSVAAALGLLVWWRRRR